jgi:hypothetical protein
MELVKRGRNRGLSPHQVAKEIVVSHLLSFSSELNMGAKYPSYSSDVNIPAIAPNYTSEINIGNKYPIYSSDIYMEHKAPTYSSDVNIGNRAGQDPISVDELVQRIADLLEKRLSRKLQDQLNAFTSRVEQIAQRQAEIVERLDRLEERVKKLEESATTKEQTSEKPGEKPKKGARREKPSVCEILKEQLVLFESDVVRKGTVSDRDRLFAAIESKCGDVVIECARERVAVEKGFWQSFLEKLSKIGTSDDDEIRKLLDSVELKLFKALKESALIAYSASERKWLYIGAKERVAVESPEEGE